MLRDQFIHWQCLLRQRAVRREGGRPSAGMRPRVTRVAGDAVVAAVTLLLLEKDPAATAALFRHLVRKTQDPRQRYEEGVRVLASGYYQSPENFSGVLAGLFAADSAVAAALVAEGACVLHFRQDNRGYDLACAVAELHEGEPAYQVTYWHNRLFNPAPPPAVRLLAFSPDWAEALAVPPVSEARASDRLL